MRIYQLLLGLLVLLFSYSLSAQIPAKTPSAKMDAVNVAHDLRTNLTQLGPNDINNLIQINKSGDMSMALPLLEIRSRTMSFPVQLNYAAGIKVNQQASAVGLGWEMPFGSIVRDYGAFEPDYAATANESAISPTLLPGKVNTTRNNKHPEYNGIAGNQLIPDNYHIQVPGRGSSSFWNNGAIGQSHHFVFTDDAPWRVEYNVQNFEIDQEYSRINEINLGGYVGPTSGLLNCINHKRLQTNYSYASAIGIPNYVTGRHFTKQVFNFSKGQNTQFFTGEPSKVRYDDFGSFTITTEDGTRYVYGRALRGQKYLFEEDPYWGTLPPGVDTNILDNLACYGEFWKIDYIAEWLLTEILSTDYADTDGIPGPSSGDKGDWIRIEYTAPFQSELMPIGDSEGMEKQVPSHREWLNYSQTDKYSALMRERAYVTKIVTPIQELSCSHSQRYDLGHDYFEIPANHGYDPILGTPVHYFHNTTLKCNGNNNLNVYYPVEVLKYDQMVLKDLSSNQPLYTLQFNYAVKGSEQELAVSNYLIRDNNQNENVALFQASNPGGFDIGQYLKGQGRGKTTLLGINIYPRNIIGSEKQSYEFDYANNPKMDEIHKRLILKKRFYPDVRESFRGMERFRGNSIIPLNLSPFTSEEYSINSQSGVLESTSFDNHALVDEMGYYLDPNDPQNKGRDAWSLTKITTPLGGFVELSYERDDFDISNDRQQWQLNGIQDDHLPYVDHYNTLAFTRSMAQSKINNEDPYSTNQKRLYRTFHMPMNEHSGGLRLKSKQSNSILNEPVKVTYEYGTGHHTAVPGSYWQNYIAAFSSFITMETQRHEAEKFENLYDPVYQAQPGFYDTDFKTYMSPLSVNIRVDNTVSDEHYYTYIDEVYADNSFIRKHFGDPLNSNVLYFEEQQTVHLKGFDYIDYVELLCNNADQRHSIQQYKTEYYEAGSNNPYKTYENTYQITQKASRGLAFNAVDLPEATYPSWWYVQSGNNVVIYIPPGNNPIHLAISTLISNFIVFNPINYFAGIQNLLGLNNGLEFTVEQSYARPNFFSQRQQVIRTRLLQVNESYKGVQRKTEYSYEPQYGLLRTATTNNSERQVNGQLQEEKLITRIQYAFETYPSWSFNGQTMQDKNQLIQEAGVISYLNQVNNSNVVGASAQTWHCVDGDMVPHQNFAFTETVDPAGKVVAFSSFPYASGNPSNQWQLYQEAKQFNKHGQSILTRNDEISSRQVLGYKLDLSKAMIYHPEPWFDATYTGFEDLTDENTNFIRVPKGIIHTASYYRNPNTLLTQCPSNVIYTDEHGAFYEKLVFVDNTTQQFQVGDKVVIYPNTDLLLSNCSNVPIQSFEPFATIITSIQSGFLSNTPAQYHFTGCPYFQMGISVEKHLDLVCFADPFPEGFGINGIPSGAKIDVFQPAEEPITIADITEERWFRLNPNQKTKRIHSILLSRTGEHAYGLGDKANQNDAGYKTPIRPVRIPGSSALCGDLFGETGNGNGNSGQTGSNIGTNAKKAGPLTSIPGVATQKFVDCDFPYIASVWLKHAYEQKLDQVFFRYEIWNKDHTQLINAGAIELKGINTTYQYFEMEIPVRKAKEDQYLDVYIQNENIDPNAVDPELFVDDLLIYPKGARYAYYSYDKHRGTTHATDLNHHTFKSEFDDWGRLHKQYDATSRLVNEFHYNLAKDHIHTHNFMRITRWVDNYINGNMVRFSNDQFDFMDGFGQFKQAAILGHNGNEVIIDNHTELDSKGLVSKVYANYVADASYFPGTIDNQFDARAKQYYQSQTPYHENEFEATPSARTKAFNRPKADAESPVTKSLSLAASFAGEADHGSIHYDNQQLFKETTIDENGQQFQVFRDKWGRTVARRIPIGHSYTIDATGAPVTDYSSPFQYANTYIESDVSGNPVKIIDPENKTTERTYNSMGQLVLEQNPDKGSTAYRYDKFGRLRFVQDAADKEAIQSGQVADRFLYYKYDEWGRIIESGRFEVLNGKQPVFDNAAKANDRNFPNDSHEEVLPYRLYEYDGNRSINAAGRLVKETVYSNYKGNLGNRKPANEDTFEYSYDENGNMASKTYHLDGLSGKHRMSYQYNNRGLLLWKKYENLQNPSYDCYELRQYDPLSRISKTFSGKSLSQLKEDAYFEYDAAGSLIRKKLGAKPALNDPYAEIISYERNIRHQITFQQARAFRYKLDHDQAGNIIRQTWSNNQLDNVGTSKFSQHVYEYYYDPDKRLIAADYHELQSDNDPYEKYHWTGDVKNFSGNAANDAFKTSLAQLLTSTQQTISNNANGQMPVSMSLLDQVTKVLEADQNQGEALQYDIKTIALAARANIQTAIAFNQYLQKVASNENVQVAFTQSSDLLASSKELPSNKINGLYLGQELKLLKDELLAALHAEIDPTKAMVQLTNKSQQLDQDLQQAASLATALGGSFGSTTGAEIGAQTYCDPLVNPVVLPSQKYDAAYWYDRAGNFTSLHRWDDVAHLTTQSYQYLVGTNQLHQVNWNEHGIQSQSGYTYDPDGNVVSDNRQDILNIEYDPFDRAISMQRTAGNFYGYRYDAAGNRSVKIRASNDMEFYLDGVVLDHTGKPKQFSTKEGYVEWNKTNDLIHKYTIKDWLGTRRMNLDAAGNIVSSRDHYPYGKLMPGRVFESDVEGKRYQFTGHEFDPETQYGFHGARYYNRELGRYLSLDVAQLEYPDWSPYNYVGGNPIRRIDPSGENWFDYAYGAGVALLDDGTNGLVNLRKVVPTDDPERYNTGQDIGDNLAIGFGKALEIIGGVEMLVGAETMAGGGTGTVASGGAAIMVTGPAIVVGGASVVHGGAMIMGGAMLKAEGENNLNNQEGRRSEGKNEAETGVESSKGISQKVEPPKMKDSDFGPKVATNVPEKGVPKNWSKEVVEDAIDNYKTSIKSRKAELEFFIKKGGGSAREIEGHAQRITYEENFLKSLEKALENWK